MVGSLTNVNLIIDLLRHLILVLALTEAGLVLVLAHLRPLAALRAVPGLEIAKGERRGG